MGFFTSGLFWFVEGVLACLFCNAIRLWTLDRNVPMPPWKWVVLSLWVLFVGFALAFVGTSLGENEPTAAWMGGLIFSLIAVISAVALWRILGFGRHWSRQ
jgi:hypothetical protein